MPLLLSWQGHKKDKIHGPECNSVDPDQLTSSDFKKGFRISDIVLGTVGLLV